MTPEPAGKLELARIDLGEALRYATKAFQRPISEAIPNYRMNFMRARGKARLGKALRKNMPVLEEHDLPELKICLARMGNAIYKICDMESRSLESLSPIQEQIYYDICVDRTAQHGTAETMRWIQGQHLYVTDSYCILDGHHRWLSGMLISPPATVPLFKLKMPLKDALPFLLRFSDAQGRARND